MNDNLRLLSIGAHPADIFDQSGGTMAHHIARGDWVGCVVLTHGARVHDKVISDEMFHRAEVPQADQLTALMAERAAVKADEVRRACALLGVEEIHFFGADDAVLQVTEEAVRRLARLVRQLRPDVVLTHFPKEGDGLTNAHAICGQIVLHALALANGVDPGDSRPPHRVAQIFYFGTGGCGDPAQCLGFGGRLLQRCLYRYYRRGRQEAGGVGLPRKPRLRRGVCAQADRDQRRGLRHSRRMRLRRGLYQSQRRDPLLSAADRARRKAGTDIGSRAYCDTVIQVPDRLTIGQFMR